MYDTIGIFWENVNVSQHYLKNLSATTYYKTGATIISGYLGNMRVKINGNKVSLIGSLPKFSLGNNFQQLCLKETVLALEKLTDLLNISLDGGRIFRLDVGANFFLNECLHIYYSCLGPMPYYKRSEISNRNSLLYTNSKKALEFYDKKKEMKRGHQDIPQECIGKNVLRCESHLTKRLPETLKLPEVLAQYLVNVDFYRDQINLWKNLYLSIPRVRSLRLNTENLSLINRKELKNGLAAIGVKFIGESELLSFIEDSKNSIKHRQQITRMRNVVRELANHPELTVPNEAIKELDKKITEKAEEAYE